MGRAKEIKDLRHHLGTVQEIYTALAKGAADRQEEDALRIRQSEEAAKTAAQEARSEAEAVVAAARAEAARARDEADAEVNAMRAVVETAHR